MRQDRNVYAQHLLYYGQSKNHHQIEFNVQARNKEQVHTLGKQTNDKTGAGAGLEPKQMHMATT